MIYSTIYIYIYIYIDIGVNTQSISIIKCILNGIAYIGYGMFMVSIIDNYQVYTRQRLF